MISGYDEWKTTPPEDEIVGYCERCGEELYDDEHGEYCSDDCFMEDYGLLEVDVDDEILNGSLDEDARCPNCEQYLGDWSYIVKDTDGEHYCDANCYRENNLL